MIEALEPLKRWYWLVLLAWFCLAMLAASAVSELMYDDAFNASVAKNLGMGLGWVSSYHEPIWFNPRVTTGPSLILPLTLGTQLFGHPEWLPSVVATSLMILALLVCIRAVRPLADTDKFALTIAAILVLLSFYDRNTWLVFIGDGLLALCLCWLMLRLGPALHSDRWQTWFGLGLGIGIALLCKFYALIALVALPMTWALHNWQAGYSKTGKQLLPLLAGAGLLLLPWQLYQHWALSQLDEPARLARDSIAAEFFQGGSGLAPLLAADNPLLHIGDNLQRNFKVLSAALSAGERQLWPALLLVIANFTATLALVFRSKRSALDWSLLALGLAMSAHLAWFLIFQHGPWSHYVRIPVILSIFFWPLLLHRYLAGWQLPLLLAGLLLLEPLRTPWLQFAGLQEQPTPTSIDRQQFVDFLASNPQPLPLAGCGWLTLRALEYQLPGSGNLRDCMLLVQQQMRLDGINRDTELSSDIVLSEPVRFLIPTMEQRWNWAGRGHPREKNMTRFCADVIWQNRNYKLLSCTVDKLDPETASYISRYRFAS